MNTLLTYDGYHAKLDFDADDNIFIGTVLGINDSLYFHGRSVDELTEAFRNCIENYKDYCKQCGKTPEKEYRGSFNIRISPETHRKAALEAANEGISINQFVSDAVEQKLMQG